MDRPDREEMAHGVLHDPASGARWDDGSREDSEADLGRLCHVPAIPVYDDSLNPLLASRRGRVIPPQLDTSTPLRLSTTITSLGPDAKMVSAPR